MNTVEYVKLVADSEDFVAPKYTIIEATIGDSTATSFVWLKSVSYGFALEADYDDYMIALDVAGPDKSKLKGVLGVYSVVSLDAIVPYSRPRKIKDLGYYQYG